MTALVPMNRSQGVSKRKRADASPGAQSSLGSNEHAILDIVKGKGDMGIWIKDMRDKIHVVEEMEDNMFRHHVLDAGGTVAVIYSTD
ncbi:hypothetical protein RJ641_028608 [Dillenia turbinata]|uniref:Uncharacterized protein n=1 Tax=Dillenia turbinata TaxID=194707 RepID=A0AAN8ZMG9_9MAGN